MPPILAAGDFGKIVWVIVIIIWFISWILKQVAAAKQVMTASPPRPRRSAEEQLESEIEVFLRETDAKRGAADGEPTIEIVPDDEPRQRPQRPVTGRPPQRPRRAESVQRQRPMPAKKAPAPAARPKLGSGVQPQLGQEIGARHIQPQVAESGLVTGVAQSVQQHLGAARSTSGETSTGRSADHPLVRLLRQPDGAQQAIVLSEILKPRRGRSPR